MATLKQLSDLLDNKLNESFDDFRDKLKKELLEELKTTLEEMNKKINDLTDTVQ